MIFVWAARRGLKIFGPEMIGEGAEDVFEDMEHGFDGNTSPVELEGLNGLEMKIRTEKNDTASRSFKEEESEHALSRLPIQIEDAVTEGFLAVIKDSLG